MSIRCDTYGLLIDKLGLAVAFKICEELGGQKLIIPQKAHKSHMIKLLAAKQLDLFEKEERSKRIFVEKCLLEFELNERTIYKLIQEVEDERIGR